MQRGSPRPATARRHNPPTNISSACKPCKKRRSKCTGGNPCDRCIETESSCEYAPQNDRRTSKFRAVPAACDSVLDRLLSILRDGSDDQLDVLLDAVRSPASETEGCQAHEVLRTAISSCLTASSGPPLSPRRQVTASMPTSTAALGAASRPMCDGNDFRAATSDGEGSNPSSDAGTLATVSTDAASEATTPAGLSCFAADEGVELGSLGAIADALGVASYLRSAGSASGVKPHARPFPSPLDGAEETVMAGVAIHCDGVPGTGGSDINHPDYTLAQFENFGRPVWQCRPLILDDSAGDHDDFSKALLDFSLMARRWIGEGASRDAVLSTEGFDLSTFFHQHAVRDPCSVSTWACRFVQTFFSLPLADMLAAVEVIGSTMRWVIEPTLENYRAMAPYSRPNASQYVIPHSIGIGFIAFPELRDSLIMLQRGFCSKVDACSLSFNWPYTVQAAVVWNPMAEVGEPSVSLSTAFREHIHQIGNLSLHAETLQLFPELSGKIRVHHDWQPSHWAMSVAL